MFRKIFSIEWSKSTSCSIRGLQNELEGSKEGLAKQPGYCGDYSIKDTDLIAFKDVETQQSEEHSIISAALPRCSTPRRSSHILSAVYCSAAPPLFRLCGGGGAAEAIDVSASILS